MKTFIILNHGLSTSKPTFSVSWKKSVLFWKWVTKPIVIRFIGVGRGDGAPFLYILLHLHLYFFSYMNERWTKWEWCKVNKTGDELCTYMCKYIPWASCGWSVAGCEADEPPGASAGALDVVLGFRNSLSDGWMFNSYSVKLNSGGSGRPLGSRVPGSRNSSKKQCAHACSGDRRAPGVYSSRRDTSEIASGGVHERNTCR